MTINHKYNGGTLQVDNLIGIVIFIVLVFSFRKIHSSLKRRKSEKVYILYISVLMYLVLQAPVKNIFITHRDGFKTVELVQEESQINYSVDSIGVLSVEGQIVIKNHSHETQYFRAILSGSNFNYLSAENSNALNIQLKQNNTNRIELSPDEKLVYKLKHRSVVKMTSKKTVNATLDRIACFEIYDSEDHVRNLGYAK